MAVLVAMLAANCSFGALIPSVFWAWQLALALPTAMVLLRASGMAELAVLVLAAIPAGGALAATTRQTATAKAQLVDENRATAERLRLALSKVQQEERLLAQVVETIPAAVHWTDRSHRLLGANGEYLSWCNEEGIAAEIGATVQGPGTDLAIGVVDTGEPALSVPTSTFGPTGQACHIERSRVPLFDLDGSVAGVLGMDVDTTTRVTLEAQLATATKMEAIGRLSAGIAHEINTPIQFIGDNLRFLRESFTDIIAALELALRAAGCTKPSNASASRFLAALDDADFDFLRQEIPEAFDQSVDGIDRVKRIVQAMKDFSHPGCDDLQPVDINDLIRSTVTVSSSEWKYLAEVDLQLADKLPHVKCRADEIGQVALNLVVNASHAIAESIESGSIERGVITLTSHYDSVAELVEIQIRDTGAGVAPEIRDKVFEQFFTTKALGKGTGQGLSLAYNVVRSHGGTIELDSAVGVGTTFTIRLPLDPAQSALADQDVVGEAYA